MKHLMIVGSLALVAGFVLAKLFYTTDKAEQAVAEEQPLYWVAPMDDNYRRDKPGKSPMGMDLVPVYANSAGDSSRADSGVVTISAAVENNLSVKTTTLVRGKLRPTLSTVGQVQFDQERIVHAHPRVEGWVESLQVKTMGEAVTKGQRLYSLYSPELVAAQDEFVLALKRRKPSLIAAAEKRLQSLQISPQFIKRLRQSRKVEQNVDFYAPHSGVVNQLNIRQGFYVKPGDTLMSIASLEEVWVEAEVFAAQAYLLRQGLPVTMSLDYFPTRRWQGEVDYIYPMLDKNNRSLRLRLRFPNPDGLLKPNMIARIDIQANHPGEYVLLPESALIRTAQQNRVVLALGQGQFKSVAVKTGPGDGQTIAVLEGLQEGDRVVTSAQFLLDSESSKTSDFKRMEEAGGNTLPPSHVWVAAELKEVDPKLGEVLLNHDAIPQWQRPAMTMRFKLSPNIPKEALKLNQALQVQLHQRNDNSLWLNALAPIANTKTKEHQHD